MGNSADPDQMRWLRPADLDLRCFLKIVYPDSTGQGFIFFGLVKSVLISG